MNPDEFKRLLLKLPTPDKNIGDVYAPAMNVHSQADADITFKQLVKHVMGKGKSRKEAEKLVRHNLGYIAGYYDADTRFRVEGFYKTKHPLLGAIAEKGQPTPSEAIRIGMLHAQKLKRKK